MGKLAAAAATMGVGGTGAAGTYVAYSMGLFGGSGTGDTNQQPLPINNPYQSNTTIHLMS